KVQDVIDHWKGILGLESETIKFMEVETSHVKGYVRAKGNYDRINKYWAIVYGNMCELGDLIHEIGHIYLYKLLNWFDVYKSPREQNLKHDKTVKGLYMALLDCFNEYHLYKFPEYHKILNEFLISEVDYDYTHFNNVPLSRPLAMYIGFYIAYNSIISEEIKTDLESDIKAFLTRLRRHVIKKSKEVDKKITQKLFAKLNVKLNDFEKVKDTRNMKAFVNYVYEVLSVFPYWSKKEN
ncbi:unnamed protein product, partial [marine sediment metagenome]